MKTRIKMKQENKLSWKQKAARIGASVVLPIAGFLGSGQSARADESNYLPADFNKDGVVDVRDMEAFAEEWLASEGESTVIPVYDCGCLNEPNATYVLMNDVETIGSCFEIGADGVTLDLGGHTIKGNGTGIGVEIVQGLEDILITKGSFGNFDIGTSIVRNASVNVKEIIGRNNNIGIMIIDSNDVTVDRFYGFKNHTIGIGVSGKENSLISLKNGIVSSEMNGIFLDEECNNIKVNDFNIEGDSDGDGAGADVISYSDTNVFLDCRNPNLSLNGNRFKEETNSSLTKANSYRVLVEDYLGNPVANAKVFGSRADGELEFMVRTGADGKVSLPLIDYINREGEKERFSPYNVVAEKDGKSIIHVYDPDDFPIGSSCDETVGSCGSFDDEVGCLGQGCSVAYYCVGGDSNVPCAGLDEEDCIKAECNWNDQTSECSGGCVPCNHLASVNCTNQDCDVGGVYCYGTPDPCYDKFILPE